MIQTTYPAFSTLEYKAGRFDIIAMRMDENGYVYIKEAIPSEIVRNASKAILQQVAADGSTNTAETAPSERLIAKHGRKFVKGYCIDVKSASEMTGNDVFKQENWEHVIFGDEVQTLAYGGYLENIAMSIFQKPIEREVERIVFVFVFNLHFLLKYVHKTTTRLYSTFGE